MKAFPSKAKLGILAILSLVVTDRGMKALDYKLRPRSAQNINSIRIPDPDFDHGIRPNYIGVENFGPSISYYYSNSLGLRDSKNRNVTCKIERPRILFMGDSMTEAASIPWENTFVGKLEKIWGENLEVLNGATGDFGMSLIFKKLKILLNKKNLQVNEVVIVVSPGVIRTAFTYILDENEVVRRLPYGPYQNDAVFYKRNEQIETWIEEQIEKKFVILGAIARNTRLLWRRLNSKTNAQDRIKYWVEDWSVAKPQEKVLIKEGMERVQKNLELIKELLNEKHVKMTVVFLPWPAWILAEKPDDEMDILLQAWCRKNNIRYISLLRILLTQGEPKKILAKYFWKNDVHLSEEGHAYVASQLKTLSKNLVNLSENIKPN